MKVTARKISSSKWLVTDDGRFAGTIRLDGGYFVAIVSQRRRGKYLALSTAMRQVAKIAADEVAR